MKKIIFVVLLLILVEAVVGEKQILEQKNPAYYCNNTYELEAVYIYEDKVKFRLNDEFTPLLISDEDYKFKDGSWIVVREIMEEEAKEGPDMVTYYFFPSICVKVVEERIDEENKIEGKLIVTEEAEEEIELPPAVIEEEIEKPSLLERIINWIISLFRR